MNANFGLLPPLEKPIKNKKIKREILAKRSLNTLYDIIKRYNI
jgi:methylenetetrahydrofolate--tRNA-(uracil-5-)-methyltransferase